MTLLDACREWTEAQDEPAREAVRTRVRTELFVTERREEFSDRNEALDAAIAAASAMRTEDDAREAFAKIQVSDASPAPCIEAGDDWTSAPPKREWLIRNWLPAGRIAMLTGEGGAGKSRLALQLAANMASGKSDWLAGCPEKLMLDKLGPVVFTTWEDERDHIAWLLHKMKVQQTVSDRLRYVAPIGPLWAPKAGGSMYTGVAGTLSAAGQWVRGYCEHWQARLLVIDPRAAAFGLNENDRALVRHFMADWDAWARAINCAVLLIAHPPKSDSPYSGSTDWHAASRAVWELGLADIKPGKKDKAAAPRLSCIKSSYAQLPDPLWLAGYPAWTAMQPERAHEAWECVERKATRKVPGV